MKTCRRCNQTEGRALGHDVREYTVTLEPTCVDPGKEEGYCSRCQKDVWQMIEATGEHSYGEWNITKEASCTERGKQEKECTVCGKKITEDIPQLEHVDDNEWVIVTAASAGSAG